MAKGSLLALSVLAALALNPASGQTPTPPTLRRVRIKVLSAKNGAPINNECLDIFVPGRVRALVVGTDKRGVVTVPLSRTGTADVQAARPARACNGAATPDAALPVGGSFQVMGDYYVACQEYSFPRPPKNAPPRRAFPNYSIRKILRTGVVAANTCGKARAKPEPGELIFFERPRTFWEKLTE